MDALIIAAGDAITKGQLEMALIIIAIIAIIVWIVRR